MLTINPSKPQCPHCNTEMGFNQAEEGILYNNAHYLIPIICPKCGLELWIQALPIGVVADEKFKEMLAQK